MKDATATSVLALVNGVFDLAEGKTPSATDQVQQIARDQEEAKSSRGARRRNTRQVVNDMIEAQAETVVLAHIHPRMVREWVEARMDAGLSVDAADVELMRRLKGPIMDEHGHSLYLADLPHG